MKKLVIDESVDYDIVEKLKEFDFNIISILEISPGISDDEVLEIAVKEKAILLTEDKDFGELTYRLKKDSYGILLIRLIEIDRDQRLKLVVNVINSHFSEIENSFAVLTSKKLRIKKIK